MQNSFLLTSWNQQYYLTVVATKTLLLLIIIIKPKHSNRVKELVDSQQELRDKY